MFTITMARKPISGSNILNASKWGPGCLNIDATRIGISRPVVPGSIFTAWRRMEGRDDFQEPSADNRAHVGRWPANVILEHSPRCYAMGTRQVIGGNDPRNKDGTRGGNIWYEYADGKEVKTDRNSTNYVNSGHKSRYSFTEHTGFSDANGEETVIDWNCSPECAVSRMDEKSGQQPTAFRPNRVKKTGPNEDAGKPGIFFNAGYGRYATDFGRPDAGGASRYFKQVQEYTEFRASGDTPCPDCGQPYSSHPRDGLEPHLLVLCDGTRVKL